jgi:endonuclease G
VNDLNRENDSTSMAIGFVYKNDSSSQSIRDCAYSNDEVEEMTGFDYFYILSDSVEDQVEASANLNDWGL